MKLNYSPQAVADLKRLYDFVADKSPLSAKKLALQFQEGAEKLKTFPSIGLPVSRADNPDLIRDLYVGHYTLRYLISKEAIYVLRIWYNKESEKDQE